MKKINKIWALMGLALIGFTACNDDDPIEEPVYEDKVAGYYILDEGNWGGPDGTLSWYELETEELKTDFFATQNPGQTLGDTPNDIKIYGAKMYITAWGEDKVLVLNAADAKLLATIPLSQPHSMVCHEGKVYVSSYDGLVARIDTTSLTITGTAPVTGEICEGIAVYGEKIYVANNATPGGLQGGGNTLSIIGINNFTEEGQLTLSVTNPRQLLAPGDGYLYLITAGNWLDGTPAQLHRIDPNAITIKKTFDTFVATSVTAAGDYLYTSGYDYGLSQAYCKKINLKNDAVTDFGPQTIQYNGIVANSLTGYVYAMTEPGFMPPLPPSVLYCYDANGTEQYKLPNVGTRGRTVAFLTKKVRVN